MGEVTLLEAVKTDADKAKQIREDFMPILQELCVAMDRAKAENMMVNFQLGPDQFGRTKVQDLSVLKPL